tara:strand:- start:3781 stop:6273 length:2493 start_codon:yes stop_codon:yes gene_type:complete
MAIERVVPNELPEVTDQTTVMEIVPERTREDEVRDAAMILINEEGMLIDEEIDQVPEQPEVPFDANLVDYLDRSELRELAGDVVESVFADKESRKEWEQTYTEGLKYLGMKFDETRSQPFEGATGVQHPILAEAVTQFQAQAYKELLPAKGPVKTEIVGARSAEVEMQAERVQDFMNFYIMNVMEEFDPELDMMLFYLPLAGSTFKKVYYDTAIGRAVSKFIAPEDLVVPYEASDLFSAERVTHVVSMSRNEIRKLQLSGFYADVDIKDSPSYDTDEIQEQIDDIEGQSPGYRENRNHTIFEVHTILDLPGFEDVGPDGMPTGLKLPYIITVDEGSQQVLSIRRNYREDDPAKRKINYFIQYKFLPGLGFYGLGLSHMIGSLAKASTSILRQLIDAGTLANLPSGFKARGMRILDDKTPIKPGEFRDIDTTGGSLKENMIPLPIKEPSNVLMQLLGLLVDSGKRFASIADTNIGDMNQAMPVGTTVALLERGTKVMSAIHKRLHYSQRLEFQALARVFAEYLPPIYPYQTGSGPSEVMQADFDGRVDVIPVSDPNIFSQSQRISMAQELMQLVQSNPEIHGPQGMYEAYRRMYAALGVDDIDSILQPPPQPQPPMPMDAGLENAGLLVAQPAQAFEQQNHRAHIEAHRNLFLTEVVKTNPQLQSMIISHMMQHLQFLATQMAQEQIPPELQQQVQQMSAQAGQIPPDQMMQMQSQMQMMMEQFSAPILAQMTQELMLSIGQGSQEDPLVRIREKETELREQELQSDNAQFAAKQEQRMQEKLLENELARERLRLNSETDTEKTQIARDRLEQQARLKLLELQAKFGGNIA